MVEHALSFTIDPAVTQFGVKSVAFTISGLSIVGETPTLVEELESIEHELLATTTRKGYKKDPLLAGFRQLHAAIGPDASGERAAPEGLLSMLHRRGRLPRINKLVDIYNGVSIEKRLAIGAHDLRFVDGNLRLTITDGRERFVELGSITPTIVVPGEYAYMDDREVLCRLEVLQCEKSKVTESTVACLFIVHGGPMHKAEDVLEGANCLANFVRRHCGGSQPIFLDVTA